MVKSGEKKERTSCLNRCDKCRLKGGFVPSVKNRVPGTLRRKFILRFFFVSFIATCACALTMADLDDFFAKKDRKKAKGKKFTTTEEIAKKLEETGKRVEKPKPKDKPANPEEDEVAQTAPVSFHSRFFFFLSPPLIATSELVFFLFWARGEKWSVYFCVQRLLTINRA